MDDVLGQRQDKLGKVFKLVEDTVDSGYNNYVETNELDVEVSWSICVRGEEKGQI